MAAEWPGVIYTQIPTPALASSEGPEPTIKCPSDLRMPQSASLPRPCPQLIRRGRGGDAVHFGALEVCLLRV